MPDIITNVFFAVIAIISGFILLRVIQLIFQFINKINFERIIAEKKLEEAIKAENDKLKMLFSEIENALNELALNQIYVSYLKINRWIKHNDYLNEELSKHKLAIDRLAPYEEKYHQIDKFKSIIQNAEEQRKKSNVNFIKTKKNELKNSIISTLDEDQLEAVLIDEDNNLIIAGAGTGKTTTIAAKVAYLNRMKRIDKDNILLLSFTNNSCNDLSNRIKDQYQIDIPVLTFHKLGNNIIKSVNKSPVPVFELDNNQLLDVFESFLKDFMGDDTYFSCLTNYFISYLKPYQPNDAFNSEGEMNSYIKNYNLTSFKRISKKNSNGIEYSYKEVLKSMEELEIANFLFMHNVEYIYEHPYEIDTKDENHRQYKPDFYLPEYKIYIEHFAIDEDGKVPHWFKGTKDKTATQLYNEGIEWKRKIHQQYKTTLIETYSWQKRNNSLLINLKSMLEERGVQFRLKTQEEFFDSTKDLHDEVTLFVKLIQVFMSLFKSHHTTIDSLRDKNREIQQSWLRERNGAFLTLFEPFYKKYQLLLSEDNQIDFNDMINDATTIVKQGEYQNKFQYIIIDEYQDISWSCYRLIKALIDRNPECKLVCVGDDWQSIYRFTGSEICFFTEFERYFSVASEFQRKTSRIFLNTTYRFNTSLINLTSGFILKNPDQIKKELKSNIKNSDVQYSFKYYSPEYKKLPVMVNEILTELDSQNKGNKFNVLLLGRYKSDINLFKLKTNEFDFNENQSGINLIWKNNRNISIRFLTVHAAKGLESDYIILLNGNSGKYGFPSWVPDDPVMNMLLSNRDQYPFGEERRLFYVALTRCKKHVYILSDEESVSSFVQEIDENYTSRQNICPKCNSGVLKQRLSNDGNIFWGCSDYPLCDFTRNLTSKEKAYLFLEQDKFEEALPQFDEYIEATIILNRIREYKEDLSELYVSRGICKYKVGKYELAISDFENGIKSLAENQVSIYFNLLRLFEYTVNFAKDFRFDISGLADNDIETFLSYIECLRQTNKNIEAVLRLNRLVDNGINQGQVYFYRGLSYLKLGLESSALIDFRSAHNSGYEDSSHYCVVHSQPIDNHPEQLIRENFEDKLKAIEIAIQEKSLMKFFYKKSDVFNDGAKSLRLIQSLEISTEGVTRSLCVKGFCYLRNEERTFSIERISKLIINPHILECWE